MRKAVLLGLFAVLMAGGGAACKSARAATPVDRPNLEVPAPPPRLIEPSLPPEPPQPIPVSDLPTSPPASDTPRPRPQRDPVTAKPEVKPEMPPETVPAAPPPPATPPQLRAPGSGPETAGEIRAILDRADRMLGKTDYGKLTKAQQTTYDTAKRFAEEGDKELKTANYLLAKELAEKAERLAKELQK